MPDVTTPDVFEFDPLDEASGSPLNISTGPYRVAIATPKFPLPPLDVQAVDPIGVDGSVPVSWRYQDREISLTVQVSGATAPALASAEAALAGKIAKLSREGGTFRRTRMGGLVITFDVLPGGATSPGPELDALYELGHATEWPITLRCRPFGRGTERALSAAHTETALPVLIWTETLAAGGDVPSLARLVLTDAQGVNQAWVTWGIQSRNYDAATTANLYYEAETRTPMSGAALATVTGSSGGATNNAVKGVLSGTWQAYLSTQAGSGGAHLTHVGRYRVMTRVRATRTGTVSLALDWSIGDFLGWTRNDVVTLEAGSYSPGYVVVNLDVVSIPQVAAGAQRWEGRIVAQSTAADTLDIDCLWLVPVDDGSGELSAVQRSAAPTSASAQDGFAQPAGALSGKPLPIGGTWASAGTSATDFAVSGSGTVTRAAVSDASSNVQSGKLSVASTPSLAGVGVSIGYRLAGYTLLPPTVLCGVIARYVDPSNFLAGYMSYDASLLLRRYELVARVAGIDTVLSSVAAFGAPPGSDTLRLAADASGNTTLTARRPVIAVTGYHGALATGGTLATGKVGILDRATTASAVTRIYDDFVAFGADQDAALFAGRSAQVRSDGALREDSTGSVWAPVSRYEGDYITVPPAGAEARSLRVIAKGSRGPAGGGDPAIDDLTGRLFVTDRYLVVPS